MVLYTLILHFLLKKWEIEKKKKTIPFWGKKTEEKQNRTTIMISVHSKGTVFPVKLKLQWEYFASRYFKREITRLTWPLILFRAITLLKVIWVLRVSTCFNTVVVMGSTVILLQCLLQGWREHIRIILIQLQEKTERNPQRQQFQRIYHLMVIVMKKLLM